MVFIGGRFLALVFAAELYGAESTQYRHLTPDDTFTVDLRNAVCPDLNPVPRKSADECRDHCSNLEGCDLWQYCDYLPGSCERYEEGKFTAGNWTRCYISTATSSRDACIPDQSNRWLGGALPEFERVPAKTPEPTTAKRGFSGFLEVTDGNGNMINPICNDAQVLGREEAWYYTWHTRTSGGGHCRRNEQLWGASSNAAGVRMGGEFVPMLNGVGQAEFVLNDIDKFRVEWTRANAHFLLGYNEPDPSPNHPHSVDAATAAVDWVKVQQVAASFDPPLRLVSPAPASEDFDEDGVSIWLEDFFGNCTDVVPECDPSLIEFIAFHDYKGDVELLERRIDGMTAHYDRPLWLTEYSIGRWEPSPLRPEQEDYLGPSLHLLENHPAIYRYVWFNSRNGPSRWGGVKDLIAWNVSEATITTTGEIYRDWPEGPHSMPTDPSTTSPTNSQAPLVYNPEEGVFIVLGESAESCDVACDRSGMTCSTESLEAGAPYGLESTLETTALALGVECSRIRGEKKGRSYPQIRYDKGYCFGKKASANNYDCGSVSTHGVPRHRICSCDAPAPAS